METKSLSGLLLVISAVVVSLNVFVGITVDSRNEAIPTTSADSTSMASSRAAFPRSRSTDAPSTPIHFSDEQKRRRCLISCYSSDGIGHQMEAKLSCIATAAALNMTYVHIPMDRAEHGVDSGVVERSFGVAQAIPRLKHAVMFNNATMKRVNRRPLPFVGRCHEKSWFDGSIRRAACETDAKDDSPLAPVFTADNCWDYFWCQLSRDPETIGRLWQRELGPILRHSYLQSGTEASRLLLAANTESSVTNALTVVVHLRRGDAARTRSVEGSFYSRILDELKQAAGSGGLRVVVHSDGTSDEVSKFLNLTDTLRDYTTIFGRDSDVSMDLLVYQMVSADVFVASKSSLSHTAALLREGPVLHPDTEERPGLVGLGWHMIKSTTDSPEGLVKYELGPSSGISSKMNGRWIRVDSEFWKRLVREAQSKNLRSVSHVT